MAYDIRSLIHGSDPGHGLSSADQAALQSFLDAISHRPSGSFSGGPAGAPTGIASGAGLATLSGGGHFVTHGGSMELTVTDDSPVTVDANVAPGEGFSFTGGNGGNTLILHDYGSPVTVAANAAPGEGFSFTGANGADTLILQNDGPAGSAHGVAGPVVIAGGTGNDLLVAGSGRAFIDGGGGDDTIIGGAGNDTIHGGGSGPIDGGHGFDVLELDGATSDYTVHVSGSAVTVTANDGSATMTLSGVEEMTFSDGSIQLMVDEAGGATARLYDVAFGRHGDQGGLAYWLSLTEQGHSVPDIAQGFAASAEFQQNTGSLSNSEFIDYLYQHGLDRNSEKAGHDYWAALLDEGTLSRSDLIHYFADSGEATHLLDYIHTVPGMTI